MNKSNLIIAAMQAISATLKYSVNRIYQARLAAKTMLGFVPDGTGRYRELCPKGAGHCGGHTLNERGDVGSRKFSRRQWRFISAQKFSPWADALHQRKVSKEEVVSRFQDSRKNKFSQLSVGAVIRESNRPWRGKSDRRKVIKARREDRIMAAANIA